MQVRRALIVFTLLFSSNWLSASVIGTNVPEQSLSTKRLAALPKDQAAAWKEYLDRSARQKLADRAFIDAELKQAGLREPQFAPSGSTRRGLPLNRPDEWYRGAEARQIADIVVSFQTPAGGWSKNLDLTQHRRKPGESFASDNVSHLLGKADFDAPRGKRWNYIGTLDNDGTIIELKFLAKVVSALDPESGTAYRKSFLKGLEYLFAAQFPTGGWPQVWPLQGGYHDAITFNDNAMVSTLELLDSVASGSGSFQFVPQDVRARTRASLERGIQCILATQIVEKGTRTVWGQQHDPLTLRPVAARNFEPTSQCSAESTRLVLFLMERPHPSAEVIQAVDAAIAWFRKTAIHGMQWNRKGPGSPLEPVQGAKPLWARYYEIGSDRPIFGDRDKSIHDRIEEVSAERRLGYAWYNSEPQRALDAYTRWSGSHSSK